MPSPIPSSGFSQGKLHRLAHQPVQSVSVVTGKSTDSWLVHTPLTYSFFARFGPRLVAGVMMFMSCMLTNTSREPSSQTENSWSTSGERNHLTGLHLFWYCHCLAQSALKPKAIEPQLILPSGSRIFYYTHRLLLAKGILPAVNPDNVPLEKGVAERFLRDASLVAERLHTDFPLAVQFRAAPLLQLHQLLSRGPLMKVPELTWASEQLTEVGQDVFRIWERLWEACWRDAEREHLARLLVLMSPDH